MVRQKLAFFTIYFHCCCLLLASATESSAATTKPKPVSDDSSVKSNVTSVDSQLFKHNDDAQVVQMRNRRSNPQLQDSAAFNGESTLGSAFRFSDQIMNNLLENQAPSYARSHFFLHLLRPLDRRTTRYNAWDDHSVMHFGKRSISDEKSDPQNENTFESDEQNMQDESLNHSETLLGNQAMHDGTSEITSNDLKKISEENENKLNEMSNKNVPSSTQSEKQIMNTKAEIDKSERDKKFEDPWHNMMSFGKKSDTSWSHNTMHFGKKDDDIWHSMMSFGKKADDSWDHNTMHFGKRSTDPWHSMMSFGKKSEDTTDDVEKTKKDDPWHSMMSFGKRDLNPWDDHSTLHFGKKDDPWHNMMSFGKRSENPWDDHSTLHFGKKDDPWHNKMSFGKRPENPWDDHSTLHFGKKDDPWHSMMSFGKRSENPWDDHSTLHFGKKDDPWHSMMSFGKRSENPWDDHSTLHFGKKDDPWHSMMSFGKRSENPWDDHSTLHFGKKDDPWHSMMSFGKRSENPWDDHSTLHFGKKDDPWHSKMSFGKRDDPWHSMMSFGKRSENLWDDHSTLHFGKRDEPWHSMMSFGKRTQYPWDDNSTLHLGKKNDPWHSKMSFGKKSERSWEDHDTLHFGKRDMEPWHSMMSFGKRSENPWDDHSTLHFGKKDDPWHSMMSFGKKDDPWHSMMSFGKKSDSWEAHNTMHFGKKSDLWDTHNTMHFGKKSYPWESHNTMHFGKKSDPWESHNTMHFGKKSDAWDTHNTMHFGKKSDPWDNHNTMHFGKREDHSAVNIDSPKEQNVTSTKHSSNIPGKTKFEKEDSENNSELQSVLKLEKRSTTELSSKMHSSDNSNGKHKKNSNTEDETNISVIDKSSGQHSNNDHSTREDAFELKSNYHTKGKLKKSSRVKNEKESQNFSQVEASKKSKKDGKNLEYFPIRVSETSLAKSKAIASSHVSHVDNSNKHDTLKGLQHPIDKLLEGKILKRFVRSALAEPEKEESEFESNVSNDNEVRNEEIPEPVLHFGKRSLDYDADETPEELEDPAYTSFNMEFSKRHIDPWENHNTLHFGKKSDAWDNHLTLHFGKKSDFSGLHDTMHFGKKSYPWDSHNTMHFGKKFDPWEAHNTLHFGKKSYPFEDHGTMHFGKKLDPWEIHSTLHFGKRFGHQYHDVMHFGKRNQPKTAEKYFDLLLPETKNTKDVSETAKRLENIKVKEALKLLVKLQEHALYLKQYDVSRDKYIVFENILKAILINLKSIFENADHLSEIDIESKILYEYLKSLSYPKSDEEIYHLLKNNRNYFADIAEEDKTLKALYYSSDPDEEMDAINRILMAIYKILMGTENPFQLAYQEDSQIDAKRGSSAEDEDTSEQYFKHLLRRIPEVKRFWAPFQGPKSIVYPHAWLASQIRRSSAFPKGDDMSKNFGTKMAEKKEDPVNSFMHFG